MTIFLNVGLVAYVLVWYVIVFAHLLSQCRNQIEIAKMRMPTTYGELLKKRFEQTIWIVLFLPGTFIMTAMVATAFPFCLCVCPLVPLVMNVEKRFSSFMEPILNRPIVKKSS